jgi:Zn-dependent protease
MIRLPGLLFSIVVHEFCHGWAAFSLGDRSPELEERLTLNPVPHIDPFGTLFLPALCFLAGGPMFGWARPLELDASRRRGAAALKVALAGPAASLALALLAAVASRVAESAYSLSPEFLDGARGFLRFLVGTNLFLAFFHLLPLHPLDGSRALRALLPPEAGRAYERLAPAASAAVLAILLIKPLWTVAAVPSDQVAALLTRVGLLG